MLLRMGLGAGGIGRESRPRILGRRGGCRTPPGPEGSNGRWSSVRPGIVGRLVCLIPRSLRDRRPSRNEAAPERAIRMTYLVLARKYRPQRFGEMSGQAHVVRTLSNALKTGQLAHAFLFTGPRGVGKTTTAR